MKWGAEWPAKHDLSSLRLLGSVGEPINPEAWMWYQKNVGRGKCPVVDTWWQTETGMIMISPLPGVTKTRPGSATQAFPGVEAKILDLAGKEVKVGGGYLAITRPWPAMLRTIWGDDERYVQTYWSKWGKGVYFPGDGAKRDKDGYFWLLGRVDDVMNVAGHRIGTMEVESALVDHPAVAEAAVVGVADDLKGTAIAAFVILKEKGRTSSAAEDQKLQETVRGARRQEDRRHRQAGPALLRRGPSQDALGQDHAAPSAGHRGGPRARRHDHPRRLGRRRGAQGAVRGKRRLTNTARA